MLSIFPTTTPVKGGATGVIESTSSPAMVNCCASFPLVSFGLTHSRNHCSLNFIIIKDRLNPFPKLCKLLEEAQIIFEKQAQIVHTIA